MSRAIELSGADVDAIAAGYLGAQLWAQLDYDHPSCDCHTDDPVNACHNYNLDENYGVDDVAAEYVAAITAELSDVVAAHPLAVRMYLNTLGRYEQQRSQYDRNELFGHDFYLTREGHGAGFWDRGLGDLGDYLTRIADSYGSAAELTDDGHGTLVSA